MSRIGVVGLAIRCAGANNEVEFAKLLETGETGIRASVGKDVPASRFTADRYAPFCAPIAGATLFDRGVFEISEVEAENMDPQHRQALEIALEAFESANIRPRSYDGSIGVFATSGNTLNSYGLSPFHV